MSEEQVDALQNEIKKLNEHVLNLNEENEVLKYELSSKTSNPGKINDNVACKCLMPESYDERCSHQVNIGLGDLNCLLRIIM